MAVETKREPSSSRTRHDPRQIFNEEGKFLLELRLESCKQLMTTLQTQTPLTDLEHFLGQDYARSALIHVETTSCDPGAGRVQLKVVSLVDVTAAPSFAGSTRLHHDHFRSATLTLTKHPNLECLLELTLSTY